jgi:aerobic-type carbon monoxide dehydrogenase small subunit (CoxS/CutS family)/carbon monoxide dehydrogenase subunit G
VKKTGKTVSPPGQHRVEADELAETRLTVNGVPVIIRLPARVTLADALRDHLGLTGTHLGCEHGICGMCTVLVDGAAARSCLLFACQLGGAEIVTVEGLGRPGNLHPLQEAFGEQHALQCGFCTPGFLMSAYDLLSHHPGVTEEELPEELSGVLCRCTGYRNILAAVGQVADAHREEGLPGPRNCGAPAFARRSPRSAAVTLPGGGAVLAGVVFPGAGDQGAPAAGGTTGMAGGAGGPDAGGSGMPGGPGDPGADVAEVRVPQGPPTFVAEVTSTLSASPGDVWRILGDVRMVARCLPGAELTEDLGGDRYRGRARVAVGPVRLSFSGLAVVIEREEQTRTMRVLAQGRDAGGGQTRADIRVTAAPASAGPDADGPDGSGPGGGGCQLTAEARVYLSGRIAQFGRALAGDVSRRLFEQFAAAVGQTVASGAPPESPVPPGALRMLAAAMAARLRAALRWARRAG